MRQRQSRFLSIPDVESVAASLVAAPAPRARAAAAPTVVTLPKPDELTWWDWTVFLLHSAAEIEHALMVQYLYAAYSLGQPPFAGTQVPANAGSLVGGWSRTILEIARQEMAHLLTVENLLRFIGGPLNLEREDLPFRTILYPFPFQLEPLSKTSLAKYVSAEQPANPNEPNELMEEIHRRATGGTGGVGINRVGVLYHTLTEIFADPTHLLDSDLDPSTRATYQADPDDWFGSEDFLVRAVASRDEAVEALRLIGEQGEGPDNPSSVTPAVPSHFDHFIAIYKAFPETDPEVGDVPWVPTRPVPVNPSTLPDPDSDPDIESGRITHPTTRLWAQLFNVRYRMLLLDLAHYLHLSGPLLNAQGETLPRGHLHAWTFEEMRSGVRAIGRRLTRLPRRESGGADAAGPPFELPYTLTLPDRERDRWRLHLTLLDTSGFLIGNLETTVGNDAILDDLKGLDAAARSIVEVQVATT